jgi:hypothetical protein
MNSSVVNYGKIKRDIILRDTGGDGRFTSKRYIDRKKESSRMACRKFQYS